VLTPPTEAEIVQLVLSEIQAELRGMQHGWLLRKLLGEPPGEAYVQQRSLLGVKNHMTGPLLGQWHITLEEITATPTGFALPAMTANSRRYYSWASFKFVICEDLNSVVVHSLLGPRRGSGSRYRISFENNEPALTFAEGLWMT
jgi:hypothetical protein